MRQIVNLFFSKLKFDYGNKNFNVTKSELIRFGKSINDSLDDIQAYVKGLDNYVISFSNLKDFYK